MNFRSAAAAALITGGLSVAAFAQQGANWSYDGKTGPLNWAHLDPAYEACGHGKEQSPIDIRGAHLNKALKPLEFHYVKIGRASCRERV